MMNILPAAPLGTTDQMSPDRAAVPPADIGLLSLRKLGPTIAQLRQHHQLNILSIEALAAATRLQANVYLSAPSPQLERALRSANLKIKVQPPTRRR